MIRVLHVVHTMDCGGIETMLMNLYRRIDKSKIQFDFLVNGEKENYYTEEIEKMGGRVLNVTPKRVNLIKNLSETQTWMKKGKYEIVHIHQDSMIFPAIWCARKAGIKNIITHAHTTNVDGWYRKIATYIGRKYINKYASLKFACSNLAAKWIYGEKDKNYLLFKNAIDSEKYRYNEDSYFKNRKELNIDKNAFVLGTCGRLSVEKNQKFLIEIFSYIKPIIPNSKLMLIGDGVERDNLLDIAKKKGVINDIIITGLVSNTEYYYSVLDCFVLPSFYEGLPLTGIEAQAAGLPCFFSTGISKEVKITPDVYFLSLQDSIEDWTNQIINIKSFRKDNYEVVKKSGYDINENVYILEKKYLSFVEKGRE